MTAADLIIVARKSAGLSLRALAARARTSASTLSAYEHGTVEPALSTLRRIIEAAGSELTVGVQPRLTRDDRVKLALHERVAQLLTADPESVRVRARRNLSRLRWVHRDGSANLYFEEWSSLLDASTEELRTVLTARDQRSLDLRNVSPFAGVLSGEELEAILREEWSREA